jgi:hypothetical protein
MDIKYLEYVHLKFLNFERNIFDSQGKYMSN